MIKSIIAGILGVFGILCILYGIMIQATRSGTKFFLVWFGMALVFVMMGIGIYCGIWDKIPMVVRGGILLVFALGMTSFIIVEGCIISSLATEEKENLDYIIVLGAQVKESGPSIVLKYRLDKALEYMNENPKTICIVSGGQGYNEPYSEAEGMAKYLIEQGMSSDRIIKEDKSKTTEQNIANSMKYIKKKATIGLVTNNFHVYRALQIAKNQKIENIYGIAADSSAFYMPNNMFREYLAEMKYQVRKVLHLNHRGEN